MLNQTLESSNYIIRIPLKPVNSSYIKGSLKNNSIVLTNNIRNADWYSYEEIFKYVKKIKRTYNVSYLEIIKITYIHDSFVR